MIDHTNDVEVVKLAEKLFADRIDFYVDDATVLAEKCLIAAVQFDRVQSDYQLGKYDEFLTCALDDNDDDCCQGCIGCDDPLDEAREAVNEIKAKEAAAAKNLEMILSNLLGAKVTITKE